MGCCSEGIRARCAITSIEHYTQYLKSFDNRDLIRGVKFASKSVTLLNLYLDSSNEEVNKKDLNVILDATVRLCKDLPEDIITSDSIKNDVPGILTYLGILKSKINKRMSNMRFEDEVKKHLSTYKQVKLKIKESGAYKGRKLGHILPRDRKEENIFPDIREDFFSLFDIKLHPSFHHLNSSQALCINFFYPLIKNQQIHEFLNYLGINEQPNEFVFEKPSEIEQEKINNTEFDEYVRKNPTCFDFYISTDLGKKIYIEVKYSERNFGKAENDAAHKEKFEKVYSDLCLGKVVDSYCEREMFLDNYQLLRNVIHVGENSFVVFIIPKANTKIYSLSNLAKNSIVSNQFYEKILVVTWEDIIRQNFAHPALEEKYFTFIESL